MSFKKLRTSVTELDIGTILIFLLFCDEVMHGHNDC